ncbi:hypothetical protein [Lactococcus lactis]|uniref:Uncharacterized protein n=1 Tax=Lactococcus lactis TaxID=1358 RepID=A0AAP3YZN7_9LACT|nr:hypothetical protein [Lactococcus lactis]MDG4968950.1 hypothetical protein [Lactococcus lactis]MDG4975673.1 hypothetical protein [Lactococcus lactis]MDG5103045.1 hypothetical protein [Lactococcus lactis]
MNESNDKIIVLDDYRLSDKYLLDELRKADIYHRRWISERQKQFFRQYLTNVIDSRFNKNDKK